MHELGVVFQVIKNIKKVAEENNINKIKAVTLEIGEVSGVINDQLADCWEWAKKKETMTEETELKIEVLNAITYCENCGKEYPTVEFAKICPHCGSDKTYLKTGNEFLIKEIEVEDESN